MEFFDLGRTPGTSFTETLHKVIRQTKKRKREQPGLMMYAGMVPFIKKVSYERLRALCRKNHAKEIQRGMLFPILTNMGPLDPDLLTFDSQPIDAKLIVPAAIPPFFGIGVSGYKNTLTFTSAMYPGTRQKVLSLMRSMKHSISP